jgi:uncharacterized protein DUF6527
MSQTIPLRLRGSFSKRSVATPHLQQAGDAVFIDRGAPRWLLLKCPCGCGELYSINLDPAAGPAWHIYKRARSGISIYPSIWRDNGCQSHYIIWRNKIHLFDFRASHFDAGVDIEGTSALANRVLELLPRDRLVAFADVAKRLDAVPWDVLIACRYLVRDGFAKEGHGKQNGHFARVAQKDTRANNERKLY